ncbi:MAG: 2,3,4,5-tetrahydropyridine-2,6-dicarboxylate N-succinyltransferase [Candidatus Sericytochromatia bacterium]|nr:2,3,4,5-tetrahydropyridine-2,6-dicarboxylate N-succinyltransferase [Candidatus Sericytochromatia bacterium]
MNETTVQQAQDSLEAIIAKAWAAPDRAAALADPGVRQAVTAAIEGLDDGSIRVANKVDGTWEVHAWTRQAILLWFGMQPNEPIEAGELRFLDKIRPKTRLEGVRVVPPGVARHGSHLEPGVILMPGYVNIGARVGTGTMVDTWATVGSCAQIGAHVHLSGGVGIGGVLEPPTARPVIIEDGVFVGSRCIVVEGVLVEQEAVLGAGVVLTASTPIIDVTGPEPVTYKGRVPARSVVIPGMRPKTYPAGTYHVPCALIVGQRHAGTDLKTSLNDALRGFDVPV